VLIAAGGDGTVATVATAALGSGAPLAILPAGSTNALARDLGLPFDPGTAARLIFGPHELRPIDIGRCNDRPFLHMGGAGIDSKMFQATDTTLKKRHGFLAYFLPAFREIFSAPSQFTLTTELGTFTAVSPLVLVAIGGSIIWPQLQIAPDIARDDGYFDVFVFTASDPRKVVRTLSRVAARRLEGSEDVVRIRCRELTIESTPSVPVEIDGDVVAEGLARFTIDPVKLDVIVPIQT
jgi:diacylglycerol kinase family enzyme